MPLKLEIVDNTLDEAGVGIIINGFRMSVRHPCGNDGFCFTIRRDLTEIQRQLALVPVLQREIRRLKRRVPKK